MSEPKKVSEMSEAEVKKHFEGKPLEQVEAEILTDSVPPAPKEEPKKAETTTPDDKKADEKKPDEAKDESAGKTEPTPEEIRAENARLKAEKDTAEKRVADTQRAFHQKTQEAAELKKRLDEATKPQLLKDAPEFEEAIKHVVGAEKAVPAVADERQKAVFLSVVQSVHPDAQQLSTDPEFQKVFSEKLAHLDGQNLLDHPIEVIKAISDIKTERMKRQNETERAAEIERVRTEERTKLERTRRELDAQTGIPGGGKGAIPRPESADAELAKAQKAFAEGGLKGVSSYMDRLVAGG